MDSHTDSIDARFNSWKFELRYDYLNQNQLRSGSSTTTEAAAAAMQGYNQEVESSTINNYLTLSAQHDWTNWAIRLILPFIERRHSTNGNGTGDPTWNGASPHMGGGAYTSSATGLGDIRILGIKKNIFSLSQVNFTLGFKIPTGGSHQTGTSTDPTTPGSVLVDPGLQLGTGTTDLITGLDYSFSLNEDWTYFAQFQFQTALNTVNNYHPGNSYNFNVGARYYGLKTLIPLLQINTHWAITDSGSAADTISTGGTLVYLTPGLNERLGDSTSLYEMVQIPIYQYVDGVQLAPHFIFSVGLQYSI
jgi:hypothetical protein